MIKLFIVIFLMVAHEQGKINTAQSSRKTPGWEMLTVIRRRIETKQELISKCSRLVFFSLHILNFNNLTLDCRRLVFYVIFTSLNSRCLSHMVCQRNPLLTGRKSKCFPTVLNVYIATHRVTRCLTQQGERWQSENRNHTITAKTSTVH